MIIKKIKSTNVCLSFTKKYEYKKIISEESIEDNDANLKIKDIAIQLIPKIKKKL